MNSMDTCGENRFWLWVMALLPRELDNDKRRLTHEFMGEDKAMDEPLRLGCWCDYLYRGGAPQVHLGRKSCSSDPDI